MLEPRRRNGFDRLLAESETVHGHSYPGQVIGVRMALLGCRALGIDDPRRESNRLVVYVEIDRCVADAIQVVTGCTLGKRTMKYVDYGKLAATFVDLRAGRAVRIAARADIRTKAALCYGLYRAKNEAEVAAYKAMPDEDLFRTESVVVHIPLEDIPGRPGSKVVCEECGEEVSDCREVMAGGRVLCRACAWGTYYQKCDTPETEHALPAGRVREAKPI